MTSIALAAGPAHLIKADALVIGVAIGPNNRLVLAPTFGDPQDRVALNTLAKLFPDREVIGVPCRDLVLGLGTPHCMTQQQPA